MMAFIIYLIYQKDQLSLIVTMPYSYAFTTVAYAQPYTHFYITDRNNKKEKNR